MAENPLVTLARVAGGLVLMEGNLGHQVLGQLLIMNTNEVAMAAASVVLAGSRGQRSAVGQMALRTVAPALAVRVLLNKQEERVERKRLRLSERERELREREIALKRKRRKLNKDRAVTSPPLAPLASPAAAVASPPVAVATPPAAATPLESSTVAMETAAPDAGRAEAPRVPRGRTRKPASSGTETPETPVRTRASKPRAPRPRPPAASGKSRRGGTKKR